MARYFAQTGQVQKNLCRQTKSRGLTLCLPGTTGPCIKVNKGDRFYYFIKVLGALLKQLSCVKLS